MAYSTMQTGCLTGGIKRSSDVNVLPIVAESWANVRDENNSDVDWLIAGYSQGSKTDITVLADGNGGIGGCSSSIPEKVPVFGGCRLNSGRFISFYYADESTPTMQKGRASMHKNGVLNVIEGCDREIEMKRGLVEDDLNNNTSPSDQSTLNNTYTKSIPHPSLGGNVSGAFEQTAKTHESLLPLTPAAVAEPTVIVSHAPPQEYTGEFYPYSVLKDVSSLPPTLDPTNREQYLSEDDFLDVFGMEKMSFYSLPKWKRASLKKAKGFF